MKRMAGVAPSSWTRPPLRRTALRAALGITVAGSASFLLVLGASAYVESQATAIYESASDVPPRTVAIVPGARVHADGTPFPALVDRLETAFELWQAHKVKRILVSGDHQAAGYDEVNGMRRWLLERGVPSEAIFMDHAGLRTFDTMVRASRVFQVTDAVICTQRFHLPRAVYLAQHAGIDAVGAVADRRAYPKAALDALREALARTKALLDVHVLGTNPRHLGPPIPIDGSAKATWDRSTQREKTAK